jgi:V8-like Glu-specific endopeptidase/tetratricopeptide (TPR) repeat protein
MMGEWTDSTEIFDRVSQALAAFDWDAAERICLRGTDSLLARLDSATVPFPSRDGLQLLKILRRRRRFELMARVADALLRAGAQDAEVQRQYGQALIDQGNLSVAETVLQGMLTRPDAPGRELDEALGLMGRIYKQQYVNARDPSNARQQQNLSKAIAFYFRAFDRDRSNNIWQGINYVALLARARVDGLSLPVTGEGEQVVLDKVEHELQRRVEKNGTLSLWEWAIELEAAIARNQPERVEEALKWYLRDGGADAFEFASTLRQLREVWRLPSDQPPGDAVINGLTAAVLKRGGESVRVQSTDVRAILQKNFSGEKDLPFRWWQNGLERCVAIAQIIAPSGRHVGTGFLVKPTDFFDDPPADPVLLTNWHVVSKDGEDPLSIAPDGAIARFEACGKTGEEFKLKGIVAFNRRLDATFVALEAIEPKLGHCPLRVPSAAFDAKQRQRLYVIGYPGGRGLSLSLHDSLWLDADDEKLHYRTPTEGGHSGSPVFDDENWMLVGLHHAGGKAMPRLHNQSGTYEANEAHAITAIRQAITANRTS